MCDQIAETNLSVFAFDVIAISGFWNDTKQNTFFDNKTFALKTHASNFFFFFFSSFFFLVLFFIFGIFVAAQTAVSIRWWYAWIRDWSNAAEKEQSWMYCRYIRKGIYSIRKPDKVIWHVLKSTETTHQPTTFSFENFILCEPVFFFWHSATFAISFRYFFLLQFLFFFFILCFWFECKLERYVELPECTQLYQIKTHTESETLS